MPRPNVMTFKLDANLVARIDTKLKSCESMLSRTQFIEGVLTDACIAIDEEKPSSPLRYVNDLRHCKKFPRLELDRPATDELRLRLNMAAGDDLITEDEAADYHALLGRVESILAKVEKRLTQPKKK